MKFKIIIKNYVSRNGLNIPIEMQTLGDWLKQMQTTIE